MNTFEIKRRSRAVIAPSLKTADEVNIQLFQLKQELDHCQRKVNRLKRKVKRRMRLGNGRYDGILD